MKLNYIFTYNTTDLQLQGMSVIPTSEPKTVFNEVKNNNILVKSTLSILDLPAGEGIVSGGFVQLGDGSICHANLTQGFVTITQGSCLYVADFLGQLSSDVSAGIETLASYLNKASKAFKTFVGLDKPLTPLLYQNNPVLLNATSFDSQADFEKVIYSVFPNQTPLKTKTGGLIYYTFTQTLTQADILMTQTSTGTSTQKKGVSL